MRDGFPAAGGDGDLLAPQRFGKFDRMRFRDLRKLRDFWAEKTEELLTHRLKGKLFLNRSMPRPIRMTGACFPVLR